MSDDIKKIIDESIAEIKADLEADRIEARVLSKKYGRDITVEQMRAVEYHVQKEALATKPSDFDKFSEVVKNSIYSCKDNDLDVFVKMMKEGISAFKYQRLEGNGEIKMNFELPNHFRGNSGR